MIRAQNISERYPRLTRHYFDFVTRYGGVESELAVEPRWVQVWEESIAGELSREYGLPEFLPGYFAFGSNGGGELFVIAASEDNPPVFMVPAGDLAPGSMVLVADHLAAFEAAIVRRP